MYNIITVKSTLRYCSVRTAYLEIFLEERSICSVLEETGAPRHWCFNNLIPHYHQYVTRHRRIQTAGGFEIGCLVARTEIDDLRATNSDTLGFENVAEFLYFHRGFSEVIRWERLTSELLVERPVLLVRVSFHFDCELWDTSPLNSTNNDFLCMNRMIQSLKREVLTTTPIS